MTILISQIILLPFSTPPTCLFSTLLLYACPGNGFICTIFLNSTYTCQYTLFVFLSLTYLTLSDKTIHIASGKLLTAQVAQLCALIT